MNFFGSYFKFRNQTTVEGNDGPFCAEFWKDSSLSSLDKTSRRPDGHGSTPRGSDLLHVDLHTRIGLAVGPTLRVKPFDRR